MRLIAPFGFYGWGNIGDEATLQGFARLVARCDPSGTKWIGSRDPEHTAKAEPAFRYFKAQEPGLRRWWANRRAQGAVFVGGTPGSGRGEGRSASLSLPGSHPVSSSASSVVAAAQANRDTAIGLAIISIPLLRLNGI